MLRVGPGMRLLLWPRQPKMVLGRVCGMATRRTPMAAPATFCRLTSPRMVGGLSAAYRRAPDGLSIAVDEIVNAIVAVMLW